MINEIKPTIYVLMKKKKIIQTVEVRRKGVKEIKRWRWSVGIKASEEP